MKIFAATIALIFLAACTEDGAPDAQGAASRHKDDMSSQESTSITPFLMFSGQAEDAMEFYVSVFPGAKVEEISRYGSGEPGAEGTVKLATFSLKGQKVMCTDSPVEPDFTFTPAFSLYVSCATEEEFGQYVEVLSKDGKFLMPPDNYGFSTRFSWLEDRFGVSWQLNLP